MKTLFKNYLLEKAPFTLTEIQTLLNAATLVHYNNCEIIFAQNSYFNYNAFVCSGLVATTALYNSQNYTVGFAPEQHWLGDRQSLLTGTPMHYTATALEDTTLLLLPEDTFEQLRVTIPLFNDLMFTLIQTNLLQAQQRIQNNAILSDAERYATFCAEKPGLAARVPLLLLASYLKMKPETLTALQQTPHGIRPLNSVQQRASA